MKASEVKGEDSTDYKKKWIVTGIGMHNKGSQAMFFATISGLRKRFPNCEITDFSISDYNLAEEKKQAYAFPILPWSFNIQLIILLHLGKCGLALRYLDKRNYWKECGDQILKALLECDGIVDAGGYKLGSRWTGLACLSYIMNMMIAKQFHKPMWLLPQSFGPWEWPVLWRMILQRLMKSYLPKMEAIFAREPDGFECLRQFVSGNRLHYSPDMVIRERHFSDPVDIYRVPLQNELPYVTENAVALVINEHMYNRGNPKRVHASYVRIANVLLDANFEVYLMHSSTRDRELCKALIQDINAGNRITFLDEDYTCFEIEKIMSRFCFVVSSRYHSAIFAFRNGTPVVLLGWSEKYFRLAELLGQEKFVIDLLDWNEESIISKITTMIKTYEDERKVIIRKLDDAQRTSVFNIAFPIDNCITHEQFVRS